MADGSFEAFLKTAWAEHGEKSQEVAERLAPSISLVQKPEQIGPFASLVSHVYGEHLGRWDEGIAVLEAIRRAPGYDGSAAPSGLLVRSIATLRYAGGDAALLDSLAPDDRAFVLAGASAIFTARNDFDRAIDSYSQALRAARSGLQAGAPALRALAIGGNNLSAALEEEPDLTPREMQAMLEAAESGLTYWKQAGTWLEEERAEYRLTRSLLKAGRPQGAVRSAQRCVAVCERHSAPAFELFFGEAILALAYRAADDEQAFASHRQTALAKLAEVPEGERRWCERERAELG